MNTKDTRPFIPSEVYGKKIKKKVVKKKGKKKNG